MKKEMKERLMTLWQEAPEMILSSGLLRQPEMITFEPYIEDGVEKAKCRCRRCGHSWEEVTNPDASRICPSCRNDRATAQRRGDYDSKPAPVERVWLSSQKKIYASVKEDGAYGIIQFTAVWEYPNSEDDPFAWLESEKASIKVYPQLVAYVSEADISAFNGLTYYTPRNTAVTNMTYDIISRGNKVYGISTCKDDISAAQAVKDAMRRIREQSDTKKPEEDIRLNYKPEVLDDFLEKIKPVRVRILNAVRHEKTVEYRCECCGNVWTREKSATTWDFETCPVCGNRNFIGDSLCARSVGTGIRYENTDLPENDLLIRLGDIIWDTEREKFVFNDRIKLFVSAGGKSPKARVYESRWTEEFTKARMTCLDRQYSDRYLMQSEEEAAKAISASSMSSSGLAEAVGLGMRGYEPAYDRADPFDYIKEYVTYPQAELVAKANVPTMLRSICLHHTELLKGSTVNEVLHLSKATLKAAREHRLTFSEAGELELLRGSDPSVTGEDYMNIRRQAIDVYGLADLHREYGIPVKKALAYLDTVYNYQCIGKREAEGIWSDYLRMAKRCRFDLSDKSRKYPASLKKEHDIAVFAYNKLKDEINEQIFAEQAKENSYLEYSYEKLFVKVPKTPGEVVEEATMQKNCLRSYITRLTDGDTMVAFIRRKDDPDKAYVTVEVGKNRQIRQVKGYCNSNPRTKELDEFLAHWQKAKGLQRRWA